MTVTDIFYQVFLRRDGCKYEDTPNYRFFALQSLCSPAINTDSCSSAGKAQCTVWGYQSGFDDYRSNPVKELKGRVFSVEANPEPLDGVLVEVYVLDVDNPDPGWNENIECGRRLGGCITNHTGRFAFDVPSGRYEVRASKKEFSVSSVLMPLRDPPALPGRQHRFDSFGSELCLLFTSF